MEKKKLKIVLWGVIGFLLLLLVYVTFFTETSTTSSLGSNAIQGANAYSGMVGGC